MIIQNMIRTVTMTVIVKVPTVIATAEDMDTELNLMDPQFWESMDSPPRLTFFDQCNSVARVKCCFLSLSAYRIGFSNMV